MTKLTNKIDSNFALVLAVLVVWWLVAFGVKTPASEIKSLENSSSADMWVKSLSSPDRNVRNYAKENILKKFKPDELGALAMKDVESEDPNRQIPGLWLLAQVDVPGRGKAVSKFLDSTLDDLKQAALDVMAQDPSPEAHDALVKLVEDEDESINASVMAALAAIGNPDDLNIFVEALGRGNPSIRDAAKKGLLKIVASDPTLSDKLLKLVGSNDPTVAREVVELLGEMKRPDTLDGLFYYLENGSPGLTMDIASAIGKIDGDAARTKALEAFKTGSSRTRRGAAKVLRELGYKAAEADLLAVAVNPFEEFWLRYYAMEALATCGTEASITETLRLIQDKLTDPRLVRMALGSLGGMDTARVLDIYDQVIAGKQNFGLDEVGGQSAKLSVIAGLGYMNTDESRKRLREMLGQQGNDDIEVTTQVVRSLGKVGNRDDIPVLKDAKVGRMLLRAPVDDAIKSIEDRYPETTPENK
jgi:HEAT repeat protein